MPPSRRTSDYHNDIRDYPPEEMSPDIFRAHSLEIIDKIKSERIIYSELLNEILCNCKTTKEKLDIYVT